MCSASVFENYKAFPCRNKAKVNREGKWFCGTHDPERPPTKAQIEAEEKRKRQQERWNRELACRETCQGVPTEELKPGLLAELIAITRTPKHAAT